MRFSTTYRRHVLFLRSALLASSAVVAIGCGDDTTADDDGTTPAAVCGDGVPEANEACDGSNLKGQTCEGLGLSGGTLACNDSCQLDSSGCTSSEVCGNGMIEGDEACDGTNLNGATCSNQGFSGGTITCSALCVLDTTGCGAPENCGNLMLDEGEVCDGSNLDGETCITQGFTGGALTCSQNCGSFNSTACTNTECGNATIDTGEECDSGNLDGETCTSQGFDGGTLACDATDCTFDETGCTLDTCGNMMIDVGEDCDGTDLDGATCVSQGFAGGTLACSPTACVYDESGCTTNTCGNMMIDVGEDCDGTDLDMETCVTQGFTSGTLACDMCQFDTGGCVLDTCNNGMIDVGEDCDGADLGTETCLTQGFDGGMLACDATSCDFDTSMCTSIPVPTTGELVITEIMHNPSGADTTTGEWFEIYNPSTTVTYQLQGCAIQSLTAENHVIGSDLQIGPLGYLALSNVAMPGFMPDYVYPSSAITFSQLNATDNVKIVCGGTTVDDVIWDNGVTFPNPNGESISLDPGSLTATDNDTGSNWCDATTASPNFMSGTDLGTPGVANPVCPGPPMPLTIGFCRLQFPLTINDTEGTPETVYGRVFVAGLTDLNDTNDVSPLLVGAVGYGPDGSDPNVAFATWTWTAAAPNPAWNGATAGEADNDEYMATFNIPPSAGSPYDYAYRFSGDGGMTWTYCDGDAAGSSNGYLAANAGQMTSQPGSAPADVWINEIHYNNTGGDMDEGVEIAGAAGTSLAGYTVVLYNGGATGLTGVTYTPLTTLTGTITDQMNGYGTVWFPIPAMQNGPNDGIALVSPTNTVIQFLSYQGVVTATNGPAMGQVSVNIGVAEADATPLGLSLQLTGTGTTYSAFTWAGPVTHSRGMVNAGQTFP